MRTTGSVTKVLGTNFDWNAYWQTYWNKYWSYYLEALAT